jgi:hypothetical protein
MIIRYKIGPLWDGRGDCERTYIAKYKLELRLNIKIVDRINLIPKL